MEEGVLTNDIECSSFSLSETALRPCRLFLRPFLDAATFFQVPFLEIGLVYVYVIKSYVVRERIGLRRNYAFVFFQTDRYIYCSTFHKSALSIS